MKIHVLGFERKWCYFWIGVYWKTYNCKLDEGEKNFLTDIWICFVPFFPLHVQIDWSPSITINH